MMVCRRASFTAESFLSYLSASNSSDPRHLGPCEFRCGQRHRGGPFHDTNPDDPGFSRLGVFGVDPRFPERGPDAAPLQEGLPPSTPVPLALQSGDLYSVTVSFPACSPETAETKTAPVAGSQPRQSFQPGGTRPERGARPFTLRGSLLIVVGAYYTTKR